MVEFRGVSKVYPNGTTALKDVNLTIEEGEFVFIVGSSGAGKSTFLKLIIHEEESSSGVIVVNGHDFSTIKKREIPYMRRSMGIVFQDFRLLPRMSVFDNVAFAMRVTGAPARKIRKNTAKVLAMVGLSEKARCHPGELSGGEQQRVGLARALVNSPRMIIADEPTGNIDPERSVEMVNLLTEINRRGTTILMVTHDLGLVEKFNRRVIRIQDGTVVSDTGVKESL